MIQESQPIPLEDLVINVYRVRKKSENKVEMFYETAFHHFDDPEDKKGTLFFIDYRAATLGEAAEVIAKTLEAYCNISQAKPYSYDGQALHLISEPLQIANYPTKIFVPDCVFIYEPISKEALYIIAINLIKELKKYEPQRPKKENKDLKEKRDFRDWRETPPQQ